MASIDFRRGPSGYAGSRDPAAHRPASHASSGEYRRAFIMLRSNAPGYGGHVRLERRTATGSLYFVVTAPESAGAPEAALAGQTHGEYYAAPIGALRRDRRGQLTLAAHIDPRNISGRPLEAYQWVVVAQAENGGSVPLTGNVEGSHEMDIAALRRAVLALYIPEDAPAADIPEPEEPSAAPEDIAATYIEASAAVPDPAWEPDRPAAEAAPVPVPEHPAEPGTIGSDPEPPTAPESSDPPAAPEGDVPEAPSDVRVYVGSKARIYTTLRAPEPAEAVAESSAAQTAAQLLGLDSCLPWPGTLEPLRRLFVTQAPADVALGDGYTYVRAPMPEGCGFDACYIGLRAENGMVESIRYALPGPRAAEPPAGMEHYEWTAAGGGHWVLTVPPGE